MHLRLASDLRSATYLCGANSRLNGIWHQYTEQFAGEIISSTIPAHEQAIDLAIAEERLEDNSNFTNARPPFQYYARRLLRNQKLAMSAAPTWDTWLANLDAHDRRRTLTYTCLHASYYVLRKLVLAYR